jgi:hypothetical protein
MKKFGTAFRIVRDNELAASATAGTRRDNGFGG